MKTQTLLFPGIVECLRCGRPCRTGTPDETKRAIVESDGPGLCATCMTQKLLLSVEPIRAMFEGTAHRPAIHGPEIFLDEEWRESVLRPVMRGLLSHTQMPEDSIHWLDLAANWNDPWPAGHAPKGGWL